MALDKLVDSSQLDADLASIAAAIRTKGGTSAQLAFPDGFVSAVEAIETGGTPTLISKSITENGTYNASSDNADGYSSVTVNVAGGTPSFPTPFKAVWGRIAVESNTKTLSIPLGNSGITKILYAQAVCEDYANWAQYKDYSRVIVRYYVNNMKSTLNSGSNVSGITEINASQNLENWNAFTGSISNGYYNMSTSRTDITAKPDVPFIYFILGE